MEQAEGRDRFPWWLGVVGAAFLLLAGGLISASLQERTPPTYPPVSAGDTAVVDSGGTRRVTLDARDAGRWVYLDVATGTVRAEATAGWDLAARRFHVIVNGGPALAGSAAAAATRREDLAEPVRVPRDGWAGTRRNEDGELAHPLLEAWYDYDFFSHLLTPKPRVYVLRTDDGALVKFRFLSYYCPGPEAGCVTLRYAPVASRAERNAGSPAPGTRRPPTAGGSGDGTGAS